MVVSTLKTHREYSVHAVAFENGVFESIHSGEHFLFKSLGFGDRPNVKKTPTEKVCVSNKKEKRFIVDGVFVDELSEKLSVIKLNHFLDFLTFKCHNFHFSTFRVLVNGWICYHAFKGLSEARNYKLVSISLALLPLHNEIIKMKGVNRRLRLFVTVDHRNEQKSVS